MVIGIVNPTTTIHSSIWLVVLFFGDNKANNKIKKYLSHNHSHSYMEQVPPFTWYELWKDFISGDLSNVMEKTIHVFQVPQECFPVTVTFTLGTYIFLGVLARMYPSVTMSIVQFLLGISDDEAKPTATTSTTVIVNTQSPTKRRSTSRSPGPNESLEEQLKKEKAKRTKDITDEYKKFAPAVLNILGKEVSSQDKFQQLMSKVEDLSIEAIIGYNWDKKVSKNIGALVKRYYPDDFDQGVVKIG